MVKLCTQTYPVQNLIGWSYEEMSMIGNEWMVWDSFQALSKLLSTQESIKYTTSEIIIQLSVLN